MVQVVIVFPDNAYRYTPQFFNQDICDVETRHRGLIALNRLLFHAVFYRGSILSLDGKIGKGILPSLCRVRFEGLLCGLFIRQQRDSDLIRTDFRRIVSVIPGLHAGDRCRSFFKGVRDSEAGFCTSADFRLIVVHRILGYCINNFFVVRIFRKVCEGALPVIRRQFLMINLLTVRL